MTSGEGNPNRDHWQARARQVARRVNLGWWLDSLSAPLLIVAMLTACGLLLMRREISAIQQWKLIAAASAAVILPAVACLAWACRKFENPEQSLVRIEAAMRMRNSLTSATAGVTPWPKPLKQVDAGLTWQWPRLLVPPVGALALLAGGLFIPISISPKDTPPTHEEPQAWKQLSSELDKLTKEEVVDEKYLEDTRKRLNELKAQEEEQWFSHSSLEATDSLKKSHRAETDRIERELGRAEKALNNIEKNAGAASQAEKNRMIDEFDQALQGLQNGAMKPNPKLLEQLKGLDLKDMAKLNPEQMEQLRESLKKNQSAMKDGKGEGGGEDWSDELLAGDDDQSGNGNGHGEGDGKGNGNGQGGVDRGPGHVPGVLGAAKDAVETGQLTGLQANDVSHATPGDLLELQDGEHDVDHSPSSISAGGSTEATGKGGERVWRDSLDPAEQRTLKRFFE